MPVSPSIFRQYDIRGVAARDLDDATVSAIGAAFATSVAQRQTGDTVIVVRDCRLHSERIFAALVTGLRTQLHVVDGGIGPTPLSYFAAREPLPNGQLPAATVMITGSHNPAEDNGLKLTVGGHAFYGADLAALGQAAARLTPDAWRGPAYGTFTSHNYEAAYLAAATARLAFGPRRFKLVLDAGNGAGGPLGLALYRALGLDVVPLYCDMDGRFPHHHPDPTEPHNLVALQDAVRAHGAELGLAYDGDADRLGAVDGTGRIWWGDQLMVVLGKAIVAEVPNAHFVGEVKCSQAMFDQLRATGATAEMWKVGHSLIKARMQQTGAALAGEMSGHLFFAHRWFGFDDALYAGGRLIELLTRGTRTLADMAHDFPTLAQTPELRVPCPDAQKFAVVAAVTAYMRARVDVREVIDIDGVRAVFATGWGLVRASNTQAVLVMRCEAASDSALAEIVDIMQQAIASAKAALPGPT